MLASTLSGEPGTLQRFAETAVGGTQLDVTELRHRCHPQGPARFHHCLHQCICSPACI